MDVNHSIALLMGLGSFAPALAIGLIGLGAMLGMARNPSVANKIQISMLIAIAFAEAVAIYVLVVSLILKFVK